MIILKNKYMKTHKYIIAASIIALLSFSSCTDWLNQTPISSVTTGSYFNQASDFEAAANNLYANLYGFKIGFHPAFDPGSDLMKATEEELSGTNSVPNSDGFYSKPYSYLRTVNNLLEQAESYKGEGDISNSVGSAYFFRAWWHFFLLKRFGGVTLALSVPNTQSDIVWGPRNSRYEVINSILSDLDQAANLVSATKFSTGNNGSLTIEAVHAFKARVALFEGTWEKYNGRGSADPTNGDGVESGAGLAIPDDYPSITELIQMAKTESEKFLEGGEYNEYSIWMECEDHNIDYYDKKSSFYLFCLESSTSNPYGVDKTSNDESIFRKCYDFDLAVENGLNISHSRPVSATRKLMDMYLCADGLPVNKSSLFKGYMTATSEYENRDARLTSLFYIPGQKYWTSNEDMGAAADFSVDPNTVSKIRYYEPVLSTYSNKNVYDGRKYISEELRPERQQAADYMYIRLPEMLLTYAEATIELDGSISDEVLDKTINIIRKRAHIADLTNALVDDNGLDMKEEIRRERAIELVGEGFRLNDLCRWGIAEQELDRPSCSYYVSYENNDTEWATMTDPNSSVGAKLYNADAWQGYITTTEQAQSTYTAGMPTVKAGALITETVNNRIFSKKNYLQPIPSDDLGLNDELLQNPNW